MNNHTRNLQVGLWSRGLQILLIMRLQTIFNPALSYYHYFYYYYYYYYYYRYNYYYYRYNYYYYLIIIIIIIVIITSVIIITLLDAQILSTIVGPREP